MAAKNITTITTEMYELLEPLDSTERQRTLKATLALLGESFGEIGGQDTRNKETRGEELPQHGDGLGENAARWMRQNQISRSAIDQLFHIDGNNVDLIVRSVVGNSRREKTLNAYLLVGIRNLLNTDEPRFTEKEAIEFSHLVDAYDRNNHTALRNAIGKRMSGDRSSAFTLTVPGLRDAANLIRVMGANE